MAERPYTSPWGSIQHCHKIIPGVFEVSTAGHGGIMVDAGIAEELLSPAAIKCGFRERGYFCFEEDCDASVVIRELLDKDLWKVPSYFTRGKEEYEKIINRSLIQWNPEYWEARGNKLPFEALEKRLLDRINGNFSEYCDSLLKLIDRPDFPDYLKNSKEVAAVNDVYSYIMKVHKFSEPEVQCLLQHQNPLMAIAESWLPYKGITDISSVIRDIFGIVAEAEKPHAEKLLSVGGTDYYLFHFPEPTEIPAALCHETLSLITEKNERYVICADVLYMSHEDLARYNIEFRKMPRDFGLLPETVQEKIAEVNPALADSGLKTQLSDFNIGYNFYTDDLEDDLEP